MAYKDKERQKEYAKEYREKHRDILRSAALRRYYKLKPEYIKRNKEWRNNNKSKMIQHARNFNARNRIKVLTHYSSSDIPICNWDGCDITDIDMLCLDHIHEDGSKHRKILGSGNVIWRKLVIDGFPSGYQVLCFNHNWKKHLIHKRNILGGVT